MTLVSVNAEDLAAVVKLAALTENRTNAEQKALLAVAERCDRVANTKRSSNVHPAKGALWAELPEDQRTSKNPDDWLYPTRAPSQLERDVHHSRSIEDGDRAVKPSWERKKKGR